MTSVVVAVLTFRRNPQLAALLPVLLDQSAAVEEDVAVLVVDNDPARGARTVIDSIGQGRVLYVHEPTPGIAAGRNRALQEATEDLLIFIDDDETPLDGWLAALLGTYQAYLPSAVVGPVIRQYDGPAHPWIEAGGFRINTRQPTGTRVQMAATNNLLLDLSAVRSRGLRFDAAFGLTGGSDSLFTRQLTASGAEIVWCDEALVIDPVSSDRTTRSWALRRVFRLGNTWSRVHVLTAGGTAARVAVRVRLVVGGTARLLVGALTIVRGVLLGRIVDRATGARLALRGAGMATGALGLAYVEYRRPADAPDAV